MSSITDVIAQFPIPLVWPRLPMDLARVNAIAIHHTATLYLPPNATEEDELNQIAVIHIYHKSKGFGGFGYHFIAFPSGRVYLVTPLTQWGTHVEDENDHLYGIAVAGTFTDTVPGLLQREGVAEAITAIYATLGRRVPIRPHRAWNPPWGGTICPGNTWRDWVPGLIELVDKEEDNMPDPIFEAPDGSRAQVGVAGKHPITSEEHFNALVAGGARVVPVSQGLFNGIFVVGGLTVAALKDVMGAMTGDALAALSDSNIQKIAKAVADEQYRRQRE